MNSFNQQAATTGAHHIGLTVPDIESSANFFTELLGWQEVGRNNDYPAVFVSDGVITVTLWQCQQPNAMNSFNNKTNIGLHHLALAVESREMLDKIQAAIIDSGLEVEFEPEFLRDGPAVHMMCFEPGGNRIEFIFPG